MKRLLMIAAAVAVLALAAVAVGGAATSAQEGDGPIGTFLGKLADKLGVSEDELETAIKDARTEMIDEAVADGSLTEEQGERLKERVEEGGILFPRQLLVGFKDKGCGPGHVVDAAADVLDMTKDELLEDLKDGNSLSDVVEAQEMDIEDFESALLDQIRAQLDEKVAEDELTQERADAIFQKIEENIHEIVNADPGSRGPGRWRHGPGGFDRPLQGSSDDEAFDLPEPSDVTA